MKSSQVIISVVIPAYNSQDSISKCIDSVLMQSQPCVEVIVVNDGSVDNTKKIVECNYKDKVKFISISNSGVSAARNVGSNYAEGKWIIFLDSDDYLINGSLLSILDNIRDDVVGVYGHHYKIFKGEDVSVDVMRTNIVLPNGDILLELLARNFIVNGACLAIKKEVFDFVGKFDESLKFAEDWELWCRIAAQGKIKSLSDKYISAYVVSSSGANFNERSDSLVLKFDAIDKVFSNRYYLQRFGLFKIYLCKRKFLSRYYWDTLRTKMKGMSFRAIIFYIVLGGVKYPEVFFRLKDVVKYLKTIKKWRI